MSPGAGELIIRVTSLRPVVFAIIFLRRLPRKNWPSSITKLLHPNEVPLNSPCPFPALSQVDFYGIYKVAVEKMRRVGHDVSEVPADAKQRDVLQSFHAAFTSDDARPFVVIDLAAPLRRLLRWRNYLPDVKPHYAVKCNPDPGILGVLAAANGSFDCASPKEVELVIAAGVPKAELDRRVIYANPCKSAAAIRAVTNAGIRRMTADCEEEISKCISLTNGTCQLIIRLAVDGHYSVNPLAGKFGCTVADARLCLQRAAAMKCPIMGVSFHVGSQCISPAAYAAALEDCRLVSDFADAIGHPIRLVDLGGGWPGGDYAENAPVTKDKGKDNEKDKEKDKDSTQGISAVACAPAPSSPALPSSATFPVPHPATAAPPAAVAMVASHYTAEQAQALHTAPGGINGITAPPRAGSTTPPAAPEKTPGSPSTHGCAAQTRHMASVRGICKNVVPAHPPFPVYAAAIRAAIDKTFPLEYRRERGIEVVAEPGRYFAAVTATVACEIIAKRAVYAQASTAAPALTGFAAGASSPHPNGIGSQSSLPPSLSPSAGSGSSVPNGQRSPKLGAVGCCPAIPSAEGLVAAAVIPGLIMENECGLASHVTHLVLRSGAAPVAVVCVADRSYQRWV